MSDPSMGECDLAVIPAKSRSTRFPGKNKALLAGKPLVVHAVEVARRSGLFHTVLVSTDDPEIAEIAREAGADVPFLRDDSLTGDTVEVPAVTRHAVQWYQANRQTAFAWVCILQPPCPLRTVSDIIDSRRLITENPTADAAVSVSKYHHHPCWALEIEDGHLQPRWPEFASASRQHLPGLYHPDGTIYWWRASALLNSLRLYDGLVVPYLTPSESVLDIDFARDLEYAEWRLRQQAGANG